MMSAPGDYDGSSDGARASAVAAEEAVMYAATYKNHVDKKAHAAEKKRLFHSGRYNDDVLPTAAGTTSSEALKTGPPPPA